MFKDGTSKALLHVPHMYFVADGVGIGQARLLKNINIGTFQ